MGTPHVDTLRKFQRHHILRQYGENGHVLPENLEVSAALDAVLDEAKKGDFRWLIEAPGPRYLGVGHLTGADMYDFVWVADHNAALAFKTQGQADLTMMAVRQMNRELFAFAATLGEARPVEHCWWLCV